MSASSGPKPVVVTGSFAKPRLQVEAYLRRAGYAPQANLSYQVALLVAGDDAIAKQTAKVQRAAAIGVPVLGEAQLDTLLQERGASSLPLALAPDICELPPEWPLLKPYFPGKKEMDAVVLESAQMEKGAPVPAHVSWQIKEAYEFCATVEQVTGFTDKPALGAWALAPLRQSLVPVAQLPFWERTPLTLALSERYPIDWLIEIAADDLLHNSATQAEAAKAHYREQGHGSALAEMEAFLQAHGALAAAAFQRQYASWLAGRSLGEDETLLRTHILFEIAPYGLVDRRQGYLSYGKG